LDIVGGHGRIPGGEQVAQRAIEGAGSGLQEPMGSFLRPLHLLLLGEAPADDEVVLMSMNYGFFVLLCAPAWIE
jgi:hypothetical protein